MGAETAERESDSELGRLRRQGRPVLGAEVVTAAGPTVNGDVLYIE